MRNISSSSHGKSTTSPLAAQEEGGASTSPYTEGAGGGIGGAVWGADNTDNCFRPMEDKARKGKGKDDDDEKIAHEL